MNDTPPEITKKQYELFFKIPESQRIKQAFEMVEFGFMVVDNSIRETYPNISEQDFKIEKIKRLYRNDLSKEEIIRIIDQIKQKNIS